MKYTKFTVLRVNGYASAGIGKQMIDLLIAVLYGFVYDLLKLIYRKSRPFPLSLVTQVAEMHGHQGTYEFMLTQNLENTDLRKIEIRQISHEVGYPKLEKISKEQGEHTDADFPFVLGGEDSKKIRITYNMGEGLLRKCKVRTTVEHKRGKNRYIEDVNIIFKP